MSNLIVIICDNCHFKRAMSWKLEIPLLVCASHRIQPAVKEILAEEEVTIMQVHKLTTKLRTRPMSDKLWNPTLLRPKICNVTKWSSAFEMLPLYTKLHDFVINLDEEDIDALLQNPAAKCRVDNLVKKLAELILSQKPTAWRCYHL